MAGLVSKLMIVSRTIQLTNYKVTGKAVDELG